MVKILGSKVFSPLRPHACQPHLTHALPAACGGFCLWGPSGCSPRGQLVVSAAGGVILNGEGHTACDLERLMLNFSLLACNSVDAQVWIIEVSSNPGGQSGHPCGTGLHSQQGVAAPAATGHSASSSTPPFPSLPHFPFLLFHKKLLK